MAATLAGLTADAKAFLSRNDMGLDEQFRLMEAFWGGLGYYPPALTAQQATAVEAVMHGRPWMRILPAPALGLAARHQLVLRARSRFPHLGFGGEPLWTPDAAWLYGKLLRTPDSDVRDGSKVFALGYRVPSGAVVLGHSAWQRQLIEEGGAVRSADDTTWTFTLIDAGSYDDRVPQPSSELSTLIDPCVMPETYVALHVLNRLANHTNEAWHVDFANEGVYEIDASRDVVELLSFASVRWYESSKQIFLGSWYVVYRRDGVGPRTAENALLLERTV